MFLLDTDHLGIMQHTSGQESARLAERMTDHVPQEFYVSIVSFHEQVAGWRTYIHRAKTALAVVRAYRMFEGILSDFTMLQVVPFDETAAEIFHSLRKQRVRIGTMDLRIAATALACGFRVLTRNKVDFAKVPGVEIEDWTVA